MKTNLKTSQLVRIPVFSVLIAVCTWICIPATVPFTMQTFAVFTTLMVLGGVQGTLAVLVYILIGLAGAPVFSGFSAGPAVLFGATGGYIIGFIAIGLVYILVTKLMGDGLAAKIISMVVGLAVCYAFGTAWFMVVYSGSAGSISVIEALSMCVIPFILPDAIKMALAVKVASILRKRMNIISTVESR